MDKQEVLRDYAEAFERLKWQFQNDYATRIDARNSYAALAARFEPDLAQPYHEHTSWTSKRPINISVAMSPFIYDIYTAGSDNPDLAKITQKHSEELQKIRLKDPADSQEMTANMVALVEALAEKEGKDPREVYEKLDDAFSSRTPGFWRTAMPKESLEAFHLAGRYVGAEKRPTKSLQDICDILYTKPSYASRDDKVKALKACAKKYLANPRTNEEYLVILADCKQDIRKLIDGKISQECFQSIKDISPVMAEQLELEGFVGKWERDKWREVRHPVWHDLRLVRDEKVILPESRFNGEYIETAKANIESADTLAKPFSRWKAKLDALPFEPSKSRVQDFLEATDRFAASEPDEGARETIHLCGKVISAFAQKDVKQIRPLWREMKERIHTHREWTTGNPMNDEHHEEDKWDEHDKFYETGFADSAYTQTVEYLDSLKYIEEAPKIRERQLKAQREAERQARKKAETEAAAKRAEEERRKAALDEIGAFSENPETIEDDFSPISQLS